MLPALDREMFQKPAAQQTARQKASRAEAPAGPMELKSTVFATCCVTTFRPVPRIDGMRAWRTALSAKDAAQLILFSSTSSLFGAPGGSLHIDFIACCVVQHARQPRAGSRPGQLRGCQQCSGRLCCLCPTASWRHGDWESTGILLSNIVRCPV